MCTSQRIIPLALIALCSLGACGTESGPASGRLSNVVVTPEAPQLVTTFPGNAVELKVVGEDEDGYPVTGGDVRFASSAPAVAIVGHDGIVKAIAPGTAQIDTWLTIGETTLSAPIQVKVVETE